MGPAVLITETLLRRQTTEKMNEGKRESPGAGGVSVCFTVYLGGNGFLNVLFSFVSYLRLRLQFVSWLRRWGVGSEVQLHDKNLSFSFLVSLYAPLPSFSALLDYMTPWVDASSSISPEW